MNKKGTRGAHGSGSIRQRPDGRWEARYSLGFDPKTGKQKQKSVYGSTQKEVRQKLTKILAEIDDGTYMEPSKIKVKDWMELWLKDYIGNVKASTVKSYRDHVNLNIIPYIGEARLSKLSSPMLQRMYNDLMEEKNLSPKSIKNIHGVLHRSLEQARKLGYIPRNPLDAVILPRIEKKQIRPLEDDQLTWFLNEIKGHKYELVYYVTVFTGMREGEILGLTWDCVNFEDNTLFINKQHGKAKDGPGYHFTSLKNDKPRKIEVANAVMDALRRQKAWQEEMAEVMCDLWSNPDDLVFTNEYGRYLCNQTVYLCFKKIVKKMGLDHLRFHDLRHTFAVNSLRAGDDIKTVQDNLGHHTAAFTLEVYAHSSGGMKHESACRMDNFIKSVS